MNFPFTVEQFLGIFAEYNQTVWPMQLVLYGVAVGTTALLWVPARLKPTDRLISAVLSLLWLWMAIAYHFLFFSTINSAAWFFGALSIFAAALFAWYGIVESRLRFRTNQKIWRSLGGLLIFLALVLYPVIGHFLGNRYPSTPTFGLPCPTTIFTLGVLMFAQPYPRAVVGVPLLWCAIGSIAAFKLGVRQDLALLLAGVLTLPAFYLRQHAHHLPRTNPTTLSVG